MEEESKGMVEVQRAQMKGLKDFFFPDIEMQTEPAVSARTGVTKCTAAVDVTRTVCDSTAQTVFSSLLLSITRPTWFRPWIFPIRP